MRTNLKLKTLLFLFTNLAPILTAQEMPKEMSNMMKFVGRWEASDAVLKAEGNEYRFTYNTDFEQTAGGSGLLMHEWADVPGMGKVDGQNLIGFDPFSKKLFWYSVDNMGTTHDHICQWKSDNEMYMEHNSIRDGKPFKEKITAVFRDPNTIEFSLIETLDGKENGILKATFKKKI